MVFSYLLPHAALPRAWGVLGKHRPSWVPGWPFILHLSRRLGAVLRGWRRNDQGTALSLVAGPPELWDAGANGVTLKAVPCPVEMRPLLTRNGPQPSGADSGLGKPQVTEQSWGSPWCKSFRRCTKARAAGVG